jgi:hypothetical protein
MPSDSLFIKCKSCGKSVSKSALKCPDCGKILNKLSAVHWVGIALVGLFVIGIINSPDKPKEQEKEIPSPQSIKKQIMNQVNLEYKWKKEGFGNIMEADLFIKNNSAYDIKDIQIQCDHFAKSGTKIDSNNRPIYEIIGKSSSKNYLNFNMGFMNQQVNTSSCYIKDFSLVNP